MEFFSTDIGIAIASLAIGAALYALSQLTWKAANSPDLAKLKAAYPVFDLVLAIAQQTLTTTKYGFAFDAAYAIWQGRGVSPTEARKLAAAMVENFDLDKYVGTDFEKLSEAQISQGQAIASQLIPGYTGGYTPILSRDV